jgi:hypothetical protein
MAIKIGHSSIDEHGKATGGAAGDQTGKELCTRKWYASGWNVLLRPKSSALAEKSAKACEAGCANSKIGYDQNQRNTLNTQAKAVGYDLSKIAVSCECDCSAFMHVCAIAGGANLSYGSNGVTTRTMVSAFVKSGDYEKLTDSKYLTSDKYLRRGDILVKEGSHTVMVLENGASAGQQATTTQKTETAAPKKDIVTVHYSVRLPMLKKGSSGKSVKALQLLLIGYGGEPAKMVKNAGGADGDFGPATDQAVRQYQKDKGLEIDGSVGPATWGSLLGV